MSISKVRWHGFPYWCVCLHDGVNEYHLLFFQKSGMFVYFLRCFLGRTVKNLSIEVGPLPDGSVQMIVEADGKRLQPNNIDLPPIKHIYEKVNGKRKEKHCYKARLDALQRLVDEIGQPTCVHKGEGC